MLHHSRAKIGQENYNSLMKRKVFLDKQGDDLEKDLKKFYKKYQKYADSVSVQTNGVIKATYTIMYRDGEIMKAIEGN